jgi:phosphoglucosamine mutase
MKRKLFGTDGIRGVANVDPMTGEIALQLGRAIAHLFKEVKGKHRIVVGKDTRLSGYMLETALIKELTLSIYCIPSMNAGAF